MSTPSSDQILSQGAALRQLARSLLQDRDLADEALQRTQVAIWEEGKGTATLPYLQGTLRKISAHLRRDETRRRNRETDASRIRPATSPASDQVVARHEIVQQLADAVAALHEPFRAAITLRFYEGLPPRKIARRLDIPVATVRSRIQRGLAALRANLDRRSGDRESWRIGMATAFGIGRAQLGGGMLTSASYLLGALIMSKSILAVILLAALSLLLWTLWPAEPSNLKLADTRSDDLGMDATATIASDRSGSDAPAESESRQTLLPTTEGWHILAVNPDENPVAGASIFAGPHSNELRLLGKTGADGSLDLRPKKGESAPRLVIATGAGYRPSTIGELLSRTVVLQLGSGAAGRLSGRVLDSMDRPIPRVAVYAGRNEPASSDQEAKGLQSRTPGLVTMTAEDGSFDFDGILAGWFRLIAMHPEFAPLVRFGTLEGSSEQRIELRLRPGTRVLGRAIEASGMPITAATVGQGSWRGFDSRRVATDSQGRFETPPLIPGQRVELRDSQGDLIRAQRIPKNAGAVFVWNPIARDDGPRLSGRVIYPGGPSDLSECIVRAAPLNLDWRQQTQVDADGRFLLPHPKKERVRLGVFDQPDGLPLLLQDFEVDENPGELRLEIDARLGFGRVSARRSRLDASLFLRSDRQSHLQGLGIPAATDGERVEWAEVPGGQDYRIVADLGTAGAFRIANFEMPLPGEFIELGRLAMPALSAVSFEITRDPSADASTLEYLLERTDDNPARILDAVGDLPTGPHMLPFGRYRLDVELSPGGRRSFGFVVTEEEEKLTVPVRVDARRDCQIVVRGLQLGEAAVLRLFSADRDALVLQASPVGTQGGKDYRMEETALLSGRYRIECSTEQGRSKVEEFVLQNDGSAQKVIVDLN